MIGVNCFEWFYQVGNIVNENGKKVLKDLSSVGFPEEAEKMVKEGGKNFARRFRCDKKLGIVDEEVYNPKTGAWV